MRKFIGLCCFFLVALSASAGEPLVFSVGGGVAIRDYDPVGYFTARKPVLGSADIAYEWSGATWQFASTENRDTFVANPEQYAPQYGGYCAYAVSRGHTAKTKPEAWSIVDNKLYLIYSLGVRTRWQRDIPENIKKGDANWPDVLN